MVNYPVADDRIANDLELSIPSLFERTLVDERSCLNKLISPWHKLFSSFLGLLESRESMI